MLTICFPIGTRPEALKAIPAVEAFREAGHRVLIVISNQDRDAAASAFREYGLEVDYWLQSTYPEALHQQLEQLTVRLASYYRDTNPDIVAVVGDTSTAYAAATAAATTGKFLLHIEAGLRTPSLVSPFPEEYFRRSISLLADFHLAPTEIDRRNLLREGTQSECIMVAPNTIYSLAARKCLDGRQGNCLALISCHRRDVRDQDVIALLQILQSVALLAQCVSFVFLVHRRHDKRRAEWTRQFPEIQFLPLVPHQELLKMLSSALLVATDSGGLQEEAAFLGIPTVVLRDTSDRPYLIDGCRMVIGGAPSSPEALYRLKAIVLGMLSALHKDTEPI